MESTSHEPNNHWHLDKRVSVGHIVTTLLVISTFAVWLMRLDGQIQLLRQDFLDMRDHDVAHESHERTERDKLELRMDAQTKRIEGRLDGQYTEIIRRLEILDSRLAKHDTSK